jgi:hypothetical protein
MGGQASLIEKKHRHMKLSATTFQFFLSNS